MSNASWYVVIMSLGGKLVTLQLDDNITFIINLVQVEVNIMVEHENIDLNCIMPGAGSQESGHISVDMALGERRCKRHRCFRHSCSGNSLHCARCFIVSCFRRHMRSDQLKSHF